MTKDEIQTAILNICKVPMHSGDFNIVAFDSFCNKLIELGAEKEREECAKICFEFPGVGYVKAILTCDYHSYLINKRGDKNECNTNITNG